MMVEILDCTPPDYKDFSDGKYSEQFMGRLTKFLEAKKYTDVTLKAGNLQIQCHRAVLAAASEYFDTMFSSGLKETDSDMVEITGTDPKTLNALVRYVYSSSIRITTDNVQNLIQAADQFWFTGLIGQCEAFMVEHVDTSNAVGFYRFSSVYNLQGLKEAARTVMLKQFPDIVRSSEFNNMTSNEIIEYVSDNKLEVDTEDVIFEAVCAWVNVDGKERELVFSKIIEYIRLPYCTSYYLSGTVASHRLMIQSDIQLCQKYLQEALRFQVVPEHRHHFSSLRTRPRNSFNSHSYLAVVGGIDEKNKNCLDIKYLMEGCGLWELLAQIPKELRLFSAVVFQRGILVMGGDKPCGTTAECWIFDIRQKQWNTMPAMLTPRCEHGSVVHNENVYVVGGADSSDNPMSSVEVYKHEQQTWSELPNMPKALKAGVQAISCGRYIFVLSGETIDFFAFDTVWGSWQQRENLPHVIEYGSAATFNDKIYVVGGYTQSSCLSYDMDQQSWTILTPPKDLHGCSAATLFRGKILVSGGVQQSGIYTSSIEEYDPEADNWSYSTVPLDCALAGHHMLTIDGLSIFNFSHT